MSNKMKEKMTEEEWADFLATKSRPSLYSRKKRCRGCGRPIVNSNGSGSCGNCRTARGDFKFNKERRAHIVLKSLAEQYLERIGCNNIKIECPLFNPEVGRVIVDALGANNGYKIAVECGGSNKDKLRKLSKLVHKIYILPYGETEPYLWWRGTQICHSCGHKI